MLIRLWVALVLLVAAANPAPAQMRSVPRPVLWIGTGIAVAGVVVLDPVFRAQFAGEPTIEGTPAAFASDMGNMLGRPQLAIPVLAGVYGVARLSGGEAVASAALHTGAALAAAGAANGLLKFGVGRLRPGDGRSAGDFRPMNLADQWQSFPSGHTVVAFALASAVAAEADRDWVSVASYAGAVLVGWSRVHEDRHWASDVVGGAIVGTAASRATVRWLHRRGSSAEPATVALSLAGISVSLPVP